MRVNEIMTRDVVTVSPKTSIHEAAQLMVTHGISGVPVVEADATVVGILSEGDLILRQRSRERLPWWRSFFADGEQLAREYRKAVGTTVEEVMTARVISVSPDLPVESAARILDQHRVRRVPVIEGDRLVGILSRGDLVKALAKAPPRAVGSLSDARLAEEMRTRLQREPWVAAPRIVVHAKDGVLSLWGLVRSDAEKGAIESMARAIDGVKGVESHLVADSDLPYWYGAV